MFKTLSNQIWWFLCAIITCLSVYGCSSTKLTPQEAMTKFKEYTPNTEKTIEI